MALEFEDQTPKSIYERSASDVKLAAPRSNPTNTNSFLYSIVKALSFRIFDYYQQLKLLKVELFPDTSTVDGELSRWANYKNITRNQVEGSQGLIIATGTGGTTIPLKETAKFDEITFETTSEATIGDVSYALVTLSRNGSTVTATTVSGHNLCSGLEFVITGANEAIFNGTFTLSTQTATTFSYEVTGADNQFEAATGSFTATFIIAFVPVRVADDSTETGAKSNLSVDTTVKFDNASGYDTDATVSFNGLSGGADLEAPEAFRSRVLNAYRNPVANFNVSAIEQKLLQDVANATRVYIKQIYPDIGQVTIYFVCDNTGVIPTGQEIVEAKASIDEITPVTTPSNSVFVLSPNPLYVDFVFNRVKPDTLEMRDALKSRLTELFYTTAFVERDLTSDEYRSKITNTVDSTGATLQSFSLSEPIGDITVTQDGEIPVLRNVNFNTSASNEYIPILFDGQDGRSNGTADGSSKEVTGNNISVDINVSGVFDSCSVTLEEFSNVDQQFKPTSIVFTSAGSFTGLFVADGDRFRLTIASAGATTAIVSEAILS